MPLSHTVATITRVDPCLCVHYEPLALDQLSKARSTTIDPRQRLSLGCHASPDQSWRILDDGLYVEIGGVRSVPAIEERM